MRSKCRYCGEITELGLVEEYEGCCSLKHLSKLKEKIEEAIQNNLCVRCFSVPSQSKGGYCTKCTKSTVSLLGKLKEMFHKLK